MIDFQKAISIFHTSKSLFAKFSGLSPINQGDKYLYKIKNSFRLILYVS